MSSISRRFGLVVVVLLIVFGITFWSRERSPMPTEPNTFRSLAESVNLPDGEPVDAGGWVWLSDTRIDKDEAQRLLSAIIAEYPHTGIWPILTEEGDPWSWVDEQHSRPLWPNARRGRNDAWTRSLQELPKWIPPGPFLSLFKTDTPIALVEYLPVGRPDDDAAAFLSSMSYWAEAGAAPVYVDTNFAVFVVPDGSDVELTDDEFLRLLDETHANRPERASTEENPFRSGSARRVFHLSWWRS